MILFTIMMFILMVIMTIVILTVGAVGAGGLVFIVMAGDVIVFIWLMVLLFKYVIFKKK